MLEHSFYLLQLFNALFSIFYIESLVKMSNSSRFLMIFTLQSSSWFCFNYFFLTVSQVYLKNITTRARRSFRTIEFCNFSKIYFSVSHFLNLVFVKCRTNSFIYSLVEQFLEAHFHQNNSRGLGVYFLKKLLNFSDLYNSFLG